MKKVFCCIFMLMFCFSGFAQTNVYNELIQEGNNKLSKQNYIMAFELYVKAKEKAINKVQISEAENKITQSRDSIIQQKQNLEVLLKKNEEALELTRQKEQQAKFAEKRALLEKHRADSALYLATSALKEVGVVQRKMENAVFDRAVISKAPKWKEYANYENASYSYYNWKADVLRKIYNLDLSKSNLSLIPKELADCPNLEYLDLSGNPYINWVQSAETLSKLNNISISASVNDLSDIFSGYWHLFGSIEILRKRLTEIPENILEQKQLTGLFIDGSDSVTNKFDNLADLFKLEDLENLSLDYCEIDDIPEGIGKLKYLYALSLEGNHLTNLPKSILNLQKIEFLNLQSNRFCEVPIAIFSMRKLKELLLGNNEFKILPDQLLNLHRLYYLDLSKNELSELPQKIGKLHRVEQLLLDNNQLKHLPEQICNLHRIYYLNLSNNKLQKLPEKIGNLRRLEYLDISGNDLQTVPQKLFKLDLTANNFFRIGEQLYNARNYQQAKEALLKSTIKDATLDNIIAFKYLGLCYHAMNLHDAAYNHSKKAIEIDPKNFDVWYDHSCYCLFVGKPEEAIKSALKTFECNPDANSVDSNLALGYLLNNQWDKAGEIYLKWKGKIFPDNETSCTKVFLQDIADLENAGITHPDFVKVKNLLAN